MKHLLYSLLLALTITTTLRPLTVSSTLLENKKTGKRVLLLGDGHDQYMKGILSYDEELSPQQKTQAQVTLATFDALRATQKKALAKLARTMLADDNIQARQTILISEVRHRDLTDLCNNDSDEAFIAETFHVMPCLFMNTILGSESKAQKRCAIFEKAIKPFGPTENSFVFKNQFRWIAGDTLRDTNQDLLLHQMRNTQNLLAFKASLPAHVAEISIEDVKNDIDLHRKLFSECAIEALSAEKALALLDEELESGNATASTPIIDLISYLRKYDPAKAKTLESLFSAINTHNKFNLELILYTKIFKDDESLHYLVINAGVAHTKFVKSKLVEDGYAVVEEHGSDVILSDAFLEASPAQTVTILADMLHGFEEESPLVVLPKFFQLKL